MKYLIKIKLNINNLVLTLYGIHSQVLVIIHCLFMSFGLRLTFLGLCLYHFITLLIAPLAFESNQDSLCYSNMMAQGSKLSNTEINHLKRIIYHHHSYLYAYII